MPESSPSVLIIRLDGIGDALALTPLLAALRGRAVPVDLVMSESNAGIFAPRAARRIVTSGIRLRSGDAENLAAIDRFGQKLRERRYSHVLVATEDPAGYRLARAVGAPVRIGFTNGWGKPFKSLWARGLLTRTVYRSAGLDPRAPHECETLFRLASPLLGDEPPPREPAALRPLILENEPPADDRIAVQITSKWERLGIPFDDVVELLNRLGAIAPLQLLSAQSEAAFAERVAQSAGVAVTLFAGLAAWKDAIGGAVALVAPDSGATHVAGMVGTPVVAVFPPSREYALQVARWAPWAAPHRIVRSDAGWPARAAEALTQLLAV